MRERKKKRGSPVKAFIRLPLREKTLFFEALFWATSAKFAVMLFPFRRITPYLGIHMMETSKEFPSYAEKTLLLIQTALRRSGRVTPWKNKCLAFAIAGKRMLKRRRLPSTLYLGVNKDKSPEKEGLKAHAWLRCGNRILTGEEKMREFTVVSTFGDSDL